MKIALVSPYDLAVPGGVNSHIHHLAEHFIALGHEVRLIAPSSDVSKASPYAIVVGRPRSIPAGGSVARMAMSPRLADPVRRILAEEKFDVVHVHEPLVSFMTIQFLRFSNAINVGTFHAARESGARLYTYTRRLLKDVFRRLDGKIAVSQAAASLIVPHFPGYYNIIPNGVDVERFSAPAAPMPELDDGMINILSVGRLEKRKGQRYLLRAFAEVKKRRPAARLVIVGGHGERQRRGYETWVREHGLRDVVFTGFVPDADLPRYFHSAQIFCAPNTGNESQGIVLLEAMAAGCPVVASNIGGFAGVVTHGVEGLLVRPKDASALADALVELIDDPERRKEMAAAGSERAQHFSWERVAQRVLSYYERLLYEKQTSVTRPSKLVEA
ncbi:MAG TPA: glycosyltransferase family 4 protein [Dehalococcoidia bacterium]|nr:glycosyltransferase family 4 protein [Dehalococcoidia bacterium]